MALSTAKGAVGEVFNVGNPREVPILELARRIKHLAESGSPIVHVPYEDAYLPGFEDFQRCVPDIRKAARAAGYQPVVSLDESLARIIGSLARRRAASTRTPGRLITVVPVLRQYSVRSASY